MAVSRDESFIARTYYESMRDNFEGYASEPDPANPGSNLINQQRREQLDQIRTKFDELDPLKGETPSLGQLFEIEVELISLIPVAALRERYWTLEDRFKRVVPRGVARSFLASLPPKGTQPVPEDELRYRAMTLLKTIHANYQVNLSREKLIRRLMLILSVVAVVLIGVSAWAAVSVMPMAARLGLLLVTIVGMAGAMISTIQRLQNATARDAMVDDGIFELIGLRVGWVGIVMSIGIGGVSGLFIYALISAGLLDAVVPDLTSASAGGQGDGSESESAAAEAISSCRPGQRCWHWANETAQALGLADRGELFKLTVYAFVSGFAERLVPDIINKIAKDAVPPAPPANGTV